MKKIYSILMVLIIIYSKILYSDEIQRFTVGVQAYEEYLPYSQYKNNEYRGFNRKVLDKFSNEKGYKFIYKGFSIKKLYNEFINEKIDFKYPDNKYWSKEIKNGITISYSLPVTEYIDGVIIHKSNFGKGLSHLKLLGVVLGFTPFPYIEHIKNGVVKIDKNPNIKGMVKLLELKRISGFYGNIAVNNYYIKMYSNKKKYLVFDPSLPYIKSTRHLSSIKWPNIIKEFNKFLIDEEAEIKKLKIDFGIEDVLKLPK